MTIKFIIFCAVSVVTVAAHVIPITYTTAPVVKLVNPSAARENVEHSFDGTVSSHSKTVHTPYSSASKMDTRTNNNFYTPVFSKTLAYAAPAVAKTVTYAAPAVHKTETYAAPAVAKTVTYATPSVSYTTSAPVYEKTLVSYPKTNYAAHVPALHSHTAPVVKQNVAYSPATSVSHVSFEGFGSHWGY